MERIGGCSPGVTLRQRFLRENNACSDRRDPSAKCLRYIVENLDRLHPADSQIEKRGDAEKRKGGESKTWDAIPSYDNCYSAVP